MKKLVIMLFSVIGMLCILFGVACGDKKDETPTQEPTHEPTHEHVYSQNWKYDKGEHWKECDCEEQTKNGGHIDENADGVCSVCGYDYSLEQTKVKITEVSCSMKGSQTLSPGKEVSFTIKLHNTGTEKQMAIVKDTIPVGAELIEGCEVVEDRQMRWSVSLEGDEKMELTYRLSAKQGQEAIGEYLQSNAEINGEKKQSVKIYVEYTLGEVDQKLMKNAIDAFRQYTELEGVSLLNMIWTVAVNRSVSYKNENGVLMTASEVLQYIFTGVGGTSGSESSGEGGIAPAVDFKLAVIPTIYGGSGVTQEQLVAFHGEQAEDIALSDLIAGDAIFVQESKTDDKGVVYIYNGKDLFSLTNGVKKVNAEEVFSSLKTSYRYAGIRESQVITNRRDFEEEQPLVLTPAQKAVVEIAEAYLYRGDRNQYSTDEIMKPAKRYEWGEYTPEDLTSDAWKYSNCAMFAYDCYYFGLNYNIGKNYYTSDIINSAKSQGVYYYKPSGDETKTQQQAEKEKFFSTVEPGDIICVRRKNNSGHAMIYVGNGRIIHSSGGGYTLPDNSPTGTGIESFEATVRYMNAYDLFDASTDSGTKYSTYVFGGQVTEVGILRPLSKSWHGQIPQESTNRVNNLKNIVIEKTASKISGQTVNISEEITYKFKIFNTGDVSKTLLVTDVVPEYTTLVSATGWTIDGENLSIQVTVPADTEIEVSFTVKVNEDTLNAKIESASATVGGVTVRCSNLFVKRTLNELEQKAIILATQNLATSTKKNLELLNEIYATALGVENVFVDTNLTNLHTLIFERLSGETYYTLVEGRYKDMIAPTLYGGRKFKYDDSGEYGRMTRLPREHNLIVGDVLFGRTSTSNGVYIYLGDGVCWSLSSNKAETVTVNQRLERFLGYVNYWAVLRPSQIIS